MTLITPETIDAILRQASSSRLWKTPNPKVGTVFLHNGDYYVYVGVKFSGDDAYPFAVRADDRQEKKFPKGFLSVIRQSIG